MGRNKNQPITDARRSNHALHSRSRGFEIGARLRRSEQARRQNRHNIQPDCSPIQSLGRMLIGIVNDEGESMMPKLLSQLGGAHEQIRLAPTANPEATLLAFVGLSSSLISKSRHDDAASLLSMYCAAAQQSILPSPAAPLVLTAKENTSQTSEQGMHVKFEPRFGTFWLLTYTGGLRHEQRELERLAGVSGANATGVCLASVAGWERPQFGSARLRMAQVAAELTHEIAGAQIVFGALQVLPSQYSSRP